MKKNSPIERIHNGIFKENPTFVMMIGMCPTLAVSTSVVNAIGMGLTTTVVLTLSCVLIASLRKIIPDSLRMPCYIGVIATFVTVADLLLQGFLPSLYEALGLYIPLIVVNCIIMGRAEAFAGKNPVGASFFDGIGMGLGFTIALIMLGAVRELFGAGTLLGYRIMPASYEPANIFIMAPGAFFVLGLLIAAINGVNLHRQKKAKEVKKPDEITAAKEGTA